MMWRSRGTLRDQSRESVVWSQKTSDHQPKHTLMRRLDCYRQLNLLLRAKGAGERKENAGGSSKMLASFFDVRACSDLLVGS